MKYQGLLVLALLGGCMVPLKEGEMRVYYNIKWPISAYMLVCIEDEVLRFVSCVTDMVRWEKREREYILTHREHEYRIPVPGYMGYGYPRH